jgi:hypothetical protein
MPKSILSGLFAFLLLTANAQVAHKYDAHELFHPLLNYQPGSELRAGSGAPGLNYWQNHADYKIAVTLLEEPANSITGNVEITYTNNSPETLPFVWLQLDQNAFNDASRSGKTTPIGGGRYGNMGFEGGFNVGSVQILQGKGKYVFADYIITDTRLQIRLAEPMGSNGDVLKIKIGYSFKIPTDASDRMGKLPTKNGIVYEIAQWYPVLWTSGYWKNVACQSYCYRVQLELLLGERPRASQHVHRRIRSERPSCLSKGSRCEALCSVLRRTGFRGSQTW